MVTKTEQLHNDQPEIIEYDRKNKTRRIIQNFSDTISLTDPTGANLSDINFLMQKFKPDELQVYLASKHQNRQPIEGYDFSKEPDLNEAMNEVARMKEAYASLPDEVRKNFQTPLEFMKFADNPQNHKKLVEMGLITEIKTNDPNEQIKPITDPTPTPQKTKKVTTTTVEET